MLRKPRSSSAAALLASAAALAFALPGCGEGPPIPLVPARGRVTFKGVPLADALVILHPVAPPEGDVPLPTGRTDAEGKYVLHTFAGDDGAPAGAYKVSVRVEGPSNENRTFLQKVERAPKKAAPAPDARYGDPERSGLTVEVLPSVEELPELALP